MDISCTVDCKYQQDGKCCLEEITEEAAVQAETVGECPYFTRR